MATGRIDRTPKVFEDDKCRNQNELGWSFLEGALGNNQGLIDFLSLRLVFARCVDR
jgi:hypothetical protein